MIKVIVVDDELPALKMAESVLKTLGDVKISGLFDDAEELVACLHRIEVDLIFVDMKMPGMNGLELAEQIQRHRPDVGIAFVTAYDYYAVDVFESEAFDYVMKPMTTQRISKTLKRFTKKRGTGQSAKPVDILVRSFGQFSLETSQGKSLKLRRTKTEELLAFFLHHRDQPIVMESIMDALWGDRNAERAQAMLYTTVYQLRKELESLGLFDVIEQTRAGGGRYRLLWEPESWDCDEFESLYRRFKNGDSMDEGKRAVELYRNGYLTDNGYEWAETRRAELELRYIELLECAVRQEVRKQHYEYALLYLQRWEKLQPFAERIHAQIIALYLLMNNKEAAASQERKLQDLFVSELGTSPDIDTRALALNPTSVF
ncbi:response regulator [Paenibacillus algorifonticola]|uniref:response regulator n=1 Tax=Paenibacillus algorifonticola TaxID=684063 RepID=UPI003D2BA9CE